MDLLGKHIHFMGIGGIGVSALAEMARSAGAIVTGCDRGSSAVTERLAAKGLPVHIGHDASHVDGVDLLVYTSAVPETHPERRAAPRQTKRGQFLADFMSARPAAVGVSGTHGKTTTSWLLSHLAIKGGLDPAVFIGGMVADLPEGNYRLGSGPFIAELDESDASFLLPKLSLAVVTNIESDHLSHYRNDEALFAAFKQYADGVAANGLLLAGIENPGAADLFARHPGRKLSFGFAEAADFRAVDVEMSATGSRFRLLQSGQDQGEFTLSLPGRHNVQNALAAIAAALELGVDIESIRASLPTAKSVERRMELLCRLDGNGTCLYSDYAHHPTEVEAAIQAVRQLHQGRVLIVFQPHLYTRTRDYAEAFGKALATADAVLLVNIYPAREEPIPGVTSSLLADAARAYKPGGVYFGPVPVTEVADAVGKLARGHEAVVMMGAGDIDDAARKLAALQARG